MCFVSTIFLFVCLHFHILSCVPSPPTPARRPTTCLLYLPYVKRAELPTIAGILNICIIIFSLNKLREISTLRVVPRLDDTTEARVTGINFLILKTTIEFFGGKKLKFRSNIFCIISSYFRCCLINKRLRSVTT